MAGKSRFCLLLSITFGYNNPKIETPVCAGRDKIIVFPGGMMKKFYYEIWLPFTITKRRILVLAIATYLAFC